MLLRVVGLLVLLAASGGCAGGEVGSSAQTPPAAGPGAGPAAAVADPSVTSSEAPQGAPSAPPAGVGVSPYSAADAGSLPEVRVETIGLHIGGGPNDEATKAPFRRSIEKSFASFRSCYRSSEQGDSGGVYGVDLRIERAGGKPQVRGPRTGMRGKAFRQCMVEAFENVDFEAPGKPTVISYSLRFTVGK